MARWCKISHTKGSSRLHSEIASWLIVNIIVCQLPLLFMWINAFESSDIFSNFLSYIFTLMISSYYALTSLRHESFKDGWNNFYGWVAVVYLLIIFGILSVYPNIKNMIIRNILVEYPGWSYLGFMAISIGLSWKLCIPALTEKSKEIADNEEKTKQFREAESMSPGVIIAALEGDNDDEE